ncbi:MAG TPA: cohesin domain-containing protein, partial [Ramlibacter sp.]
RGGRVQSPPTVGSPFAPVVLAIQGPGRLKVGEEATITLNLKADQPLVSTAIEMSYDPKALKILGVNEGPLMRTGGVETTFSARTDDTAGRISIAVARPGGQGTAGEGPLLELRVQGLVPAASAPLKVEVFSAIGPGNTLPPAAIPVPFPLAVTEP